MNVTNTAKAFKPKFVSVIATLSLSVSASSVMMAQGSTWGVSSGSNLTVSNSNSVTTITANPNGRGRIESKSGNNSLLIQNKTSIKGNNGLIVIESSSNSTIQTIQNEGTLTTNGHPVIDIKGSNKTIQNLINKGIMKNNAHNSNSVIRFNASSSTISNFTNEGTIEATGGNGIYLENIQITLTNTGLIKAKNAAIYVSHTNNDGINLLKNSGTLWSDNGNAISIYSNGGNNNNKSGIATLINESGGVIQGKENGIELTSLGNNGNKKSSIGSIDNQGSIIGKEGAGIVIRKHHQNNGQQNQLTGQIKVDGLVQGKTAGILNEGKLGSADGQEVIIVGEQGKIEGVVKNAAGASLQGNITNKGSGTLALDNQGSVSNNTVISNTGGGKVEIKDWKVENQSNGGAGKVKTLHFKGDGITVDNLTINVQNTEVTQIANAFSAEGGADKTKIFTNTKVKSNDQSVSFDGDLLRGLVANIDGSKTAAAALNRTLIATATARATFLDSVMGNALNTLSFLHHRASSS
ncbi:MAG: hypothetical protein PUJ79_02635, partial [Helicobacter sp.]|nr:hypothetical protein [Helicobacter sp.]MDY5739990.1 hypothetical protein [Helicobacter sp.]